MKRTLFAFFLFLLPTLSVSFAQTETPTPTLAPTAVPTHWLQVVVDSAFMRAEPLPEADVVGSTFEGENLQAIGRSADGTWFEARRPGSRGSGWIFNETVQWNFDVAALPLTSTAGIFGPEPVVDTGLVVFVLGNTRLRAEPFIDAEEIGLVPHSVTIPVVGRNQDATWLYVNYLGYIGWISGSQARPFGDVMSAPLGYDLPALDFEVIIIPPEVQLAQLNRLRDYIETQRQLAVNLESYWDAVLDGSILPCTPPDFVTEFARVEQDIMQLPEMQRYLPRLDEATTRVNDSVEPLHDCGAYEADTLIDARADAINARIVFDVTLDQLETLESIIR